MDTAELQKLISESDNIVFFGGAGVSTESGIPDFRSVDGLYNKRYKYPPESILSHTFFIENTAEFYDFYKTKMLHLNAKPNVAHMTLARLEDAGKLKAVITQNIDGLHQAAGSRNVIELHGSVRRNFCMDCGKAYSISTLLNSSDYIPKCSCDGIIKPDVVLYEEPLNNDVMKEAEGYIRDADVLIIGGTSLGVYPAAGLIRYYTGDKLVLINKSVTPMDKHANLILRGGIGSILGGLEF